MNQVLIIGRIASDYIIKIKDDKTILSTHIAVNEHIKNKETNEHEEHTQFFRVIFFGNTAKYIQEYLKKGDKIFVQGKNSLKNIQDENGKYKTFFNIICQKMEFISSPKNKNENSVENEQEETKSFSINKLNIGNSEINKKEEELLLNVDFLVEDQSK